MFKNQREEIRKFLTGIQDHICGEVSTLHQGPYKEDLWQREGGGGGKTRIFSEGLFLEKGGVNFSEVFGELTPEFAKSMPHGSGLNFYATGVSLVLHPVNPFVPTVHANYRYIERGDAFWFGGGADLTPFYPFREDAVHFHQAHKDALDPFGIELYPKFKKECDSYFYLPHRKETRGVGGIFFDYQMGDFEKVFAMVKSCGEAFAKAYIPIAKKRMSVSYNEKQKEFQEIRRGRYVEFNLLYDRGTTFGLKTNGRVESILMSLPAKARWEYNFIPPEGSEESKIFEFLKPTDWLGLNS